MWLTPGLSVQCKVETWSEIYWSIYTEDHGDWSTEEIKRFMFKQIDDTKQLWISISNSRKTPIISPDEIWAAREERREISAAPSNFILIPKTCPHKGTLLSIGLHEENLYHAPTQLQTGRRAMGTH